MTSANSRRSTTSPLDGVRRRGAFVDGSEVVPAEGTYVPVEDPSSGKVLAEVLSSPAALVDSAMTSAARSLRSREWGPSVSPYERGRLLARIAALIRSNHEELALIETLDTGKPISQAKSDIALTATYFDFYGSLCDKIGGESIPLPDTHFAFTVHEPYGVVGHILPWNSPASQFGRGVAPSLACGNSVVVKPSETAPLSTLYLATLLHDAGLPKGACNVVTGSGSSTGETLAAHATLGLLVFTGSVETGAHVMGVAAANIVPCKLELGGKSAALVFSDARINQAVAAAITAVTRNAGQSCLALSRFLVQRQILDQFVERLSETIRRLVIRPAIEDPDVGPLVSRRQLERVLDYVSRAGQDGASIICGGERVRGLGLDSGYFMAPAVLTDVAPTARVVKEEVFGPVLSILPFDGEQEAIDLANSTRYGLVSAVFTTDFARAHRVAARLEAGQVHVNDYPAGGVGLPFGGYKQSGIGREKGVQAMAEYSQVKTIAGRISMDDLDG